MTNLARHLREAANITTPAGWTFAVAVALVGAATVVVALLNG